METAREFGIPEQAVDLGETGRTKPCLSVPGPEGHKVSKSWPWPRLRVRC